jgi:hypothetical protein
MIFMVIELKNAVFWDKKPRSYLAGDILLLCYRAQPVNACTIWGFRGGDYEGFRLLGYYAVYLL